MKVSSSHASSNSCGYRKEGRTMEYLLFLALLIIGYLLSNRPRDD